MNVDTEKEPCFFEEFKRMAGGHVLEQKRFRQSSPFFNIP